MFGVIVETTLAFFYHSVLEHKFMPSAKIVLRDLAGD